MDALDKAANLVSRFPFQDRQQPDVYEVQLVSLVKSPLRLGAEQVCGGKPSAFSMEEFGHVFRRYRFSEPLWGANRRLPPPFQISAMNGKDYWRAKVTTRFDGLPRSVDYIDRGEASCPRVERFGGKASERNSRRSRRYFSPTYLVVGEEKCFAVTAAFDKKGL
jgi:hypothetical protein